MKGKEIGYTIVDKNGAEWQNCGSFNTPTLAKRHFSSSNYPNGYAQPRGPFYKDQTEFQVDKLYSGTAIKKLLQELLSCVDDPDQTRYLIEKTLHELE